MNNKNKSLFKAIMPWLVVIILLSSLVPLLNTGKSSAVNYNEFVSILDKQKVTEMTVMPGIYVTSVEGKYTKNEKGKCQPFRGIFLLFFIFPRRVGTISRRVCTNPRDYSTSIWQTFMAFSAFRCCSGVTPAQHFSRTRIGVSGKAALRIMALEITQISVHRPTRVMEEIGSSSSSRSWMHFGSSREPKDGLFSSITVSGTSAASAMTGFSSQPSVPSTQ